MKSALANKALFLVLLALALCGAMECRATVYVISTDGVPLNTNLLADIGAASGLTTPGYVFFSPTNLGQINGTPIYFTGYDSDSAAVFGIAAIGLLCHDISCALERRMIFFAGDNSQAHRIRCAITSADQAREFLKLFPEPSGDFILEADRAVLQGVIMGKPPQPGECFLSLHTLSRLSTGAKTPDQKPNSQGVGKASIFAVARDRVKNAGVVIATILVFLLMAAVVSSILRGCGIEPDSLHPSMGKPNQIHVTSAAISSKLQIRSEIPASIAGVTRWV